MFHVIISLFTYPSQLSYTPSGFVIFPLQFSLYSPSSIYPPPLPLLLYSSFSVFLMLCFLSSPSSIFVIFSLISILLYSLSSVLSYSPSFILVTIPFFHFRYILPLPFVIFSLFRFCYILSPCPYIFYLTHWFSCLPILHFYPTPLFCFVSRQLIKIKKMGELIN